MAANPIDPPQPAKITRFAQLWPLLLSALVLLISGGFFGLNLYMFPGINRDFAISNAHSSLITFLRNLPDGTILIGVIIWMLAGISFALIASTIGGKVALLFSFTVTILMFFAGYIFGLLAIPVIT